MPDTSTLLIIDDCAEDRKIYRHYLLKDPHQSYHILEADSAQDGLALCQATPCDVILLDFSLPDMSGLDILDRLNQGILETYASVIMLTGRGDEEVAVQAMKKGARDYLSKQQLKADVLQSVVRNVVQQSHLQALLFKKRERQRAIATTALRIRQSLKLEQILNTAVAEVQQLLKCDRVVVYQFVKDVDSKTVPELVKLCLSKTPDTNIQDTWLWQRVVENYHQGCQQVIFKVCETNANHYDLSVNQLTYLFPENCQIKSQKKSAEQHVTTQVVPIAINHNGETPPQLWGLLVAYHSYDNQEWQAGALDILNELSLQLAIAIQQAELIAQTQAAFENEKKLNLFKSQMLAMVSHEYRIPLSFILAASSTLKQHGCRLEESKQQRFLQTIEQKARQMSKLVDDLLVWQQFELDKAHFKPQPLDLSHFFSDLIEEQKEKISDRHELVFNKTGDCKGFWGDGKLLRQIFINLMSNAINYSPNGGKIEFHLIGQDSQILFYIQDKGIGIPIDNQENLFQAFSRGSNVETIPGTGLGLSITKTCVDLHGGDIIVESQVGQGTKVTVTLPKQATSIAG
ncbi:MAG: ATP-binding protein [Scytonema sp. PMC 1069.18]|nr:ATP-binding protein [Scytonema sp. PMC 1069.18]MEC4882421.1 ATP-binding protein [Scytonema sp. PMC 1070.18]